MEPSRWELAYAHRERLLRISRRRTANEQDAEDCVNEAILRAVEFPNLDEARIAEFLTTVTIRLCADQYRSRRRTEGLLGRLAHRSVDQPGPEDAICDQAEAAWLARELDVLPSRQREVVSARAEGLSANDIARRLDLSVASVNSALGRARVTIRAALRSASAALVPATRRWMLRHRIAVATAVGGATAVSVLVAVPMIVGGGHEDEHAPERIVVADAYPEEPDAPFVTVAAISSGARGGRPPGRPPVRSIPHPTPSTIVDAGHGIRIDGDNDDYTLEQRLGHCLQYGIDVDPNGYTGCAYPPGHYPSPPPSP